MRCRPGIVPTTEFGIGPGSAVHRYACTHPDTPLKLAGHYHRSAGSARPAASFQLRRSACQMPAQRPLPPLQEPPPVCAEVAGADRGLVAGADIDDHRALLSTLPEILDGRVAGV